MPRALQVENRCFESYGVACASYFEVIVGTATLPVVGTRFYKHSAPNGSDAIVIEAEPANKYDSNALKIVNVTKREQMGHLSRGVSAVLAPLIASGTVRASVCIEHYTLDNVAVFLTLYTLHCNMTDQMICALSKCPGFVAAEKLHCG